MKPKILKGLSLSTGRAIGKPFYHQQSDETIPQYHIEKDDQVEKEVKRYRKALTSSEREIKRLQIKLGSEGLGEIVNILESHLEMLQDPFLTTEMEERIRVERKNPETIFVDSINAYKGSFPDSSPAFHERVQDVSDISKRVLNHLLQKRTRSYIPPSSILIFEELVPSFIAEIHPSVMVGFISQLGGISSHAAIIARARGIPYVGGIDLELLKKAEPQNIIVDGNTGDLILDPTKDELKIFFSHESKEEIDKSPSSNMMKDKTKVHLFGNLERIDDIDTIYKQNLAGIGLFRSEYLFLECNSFPDEGLQYATYKEILQKIPDKTVVIRVFDIGADKAQFLPEGLLSIRKEGNPVLGCRAIRFLLKYPELFKKQLRALVRANVHGNLHILLPMISDPSEIDRSALLLQEVQEELAKEDEAYRKKIPLGCMIEVPSMAILSEIAAKKVDFLSMGTNDLTQYLLAVDRTNPYVHDLYSAAHPSLFRMIKQVIESAKMYERPLILCGEIASDPIFLPFLIGAGIRNLSMSLRYIAKVDHAIEKLDLSLCRKIYNKALSIESASKLYEYLQEEAKKITLIEEE